MSDRDEPTGTAPGFAWTADGHLRFALPTATVLFSGRRGGVSSGPFASLNLSGWNDDDPAAVHENRRRLAERAGVRPERFAQPFQVHGTAVLVARTADDLPGAELADVREADGFATALPGIPCVVLCADCLPVALVAEGAVAMVHAGWRGLVGGVLESGRAALHEAGGRGPVTAVVGPGAGACCYEVGDEVHAALAPLGPTVRVGDHADLASAAELRLRAAGVGSVHVARHCTICDPERFFSYRRDAGRTGRQAGVAWLT